MRKLTLLFIVLLITAMPTFAQTGDVDVDIPDVPAGQQVTVTYRARVNTVLPLGLQFIVDQGRITLNGQTLLTDDPRVTGSIDPTRTGVSPSATTLPATGETPWWRTVIFIGGVAFVMALAVTFLLSKQPTRAKS
ncbi:MAG: hypothetical protein KJ043_19305 [Anaerolineae bacterium]|nr:hypothetical protein [Anaerolineae bacterium]